MEGEASGNHYCIRIVPNVKTMKDKYDEHTVVDDLNRKHDLRVRNGQIQELKTHPADIQGAMHARGDVGIKSKGKIDFLCNYKDYVHYYVDKFD